MPPKTRWLPSSGIEPSAKPAANAYRPLMRRMPHDKPLQPDLRSGNADMHVGEGSRDDIQEAGRAGALVRGGATVMSGEWTGWEVAIQPVWLGVRDQGLGAGGVRVEGLVPDLL